MRNALYLVGLVAACSPPGHRASGGDDVAPMVDAPATPGIDAVVPAADATLDASTQPAVEDCAHYPFKAETLYAERLGFGAHATGGTWSMPYHVTTLADDGPGSLRVALESPNPYWIVFDVNGLIDLVDGDGIRVKSNKTVDGRGRDITVDGELKIDAGTTNIIFTDVKFQYPAGFATSDGDLIGIRGHGYDDPAAYDSHDMWFHHLELARGGDGQLDNRGATYVTVSWCHMHSHAKSMLHTNDTDQNPSRGNRTTYHHNFFDRVTRRGPQFHWGMADFFNNFQYQWYEYGAAGQKEARFLSENNIYEARPGTYCLSCPDPNSPTGDSDYEVSKVALTPMWDTEPGFVKSVGDVAKEGAILEQRMPQMVFDRSTYYTATPEPATDALAARLRTETGPRRSYCHP